MARIKRGGALVVSFSGLIIRAQFLDSVTSWKGQEKSFYQRFPGQNSNLVHLSDFTVGRTSCLLLMLRQRLESVEGEL